MVIKGLMNPYFILTAAHLFRMGHIVKARQLLCI